MVYISNEFKSSEMFHVLVGTCAFRLSGLVVALSFKNACEFVN